MGTIRPNDRELTLYVNQRCKADPNLDRTKLKETVLRGMTFLSDRPLTEAELEYGRQLAAQLGLL
jgi:hypothetical protein